MKYTILPVLFAVILLAGCTAQPVVNDTDNTTTIAETSVEKTTVETTILNNTTETTIRLGEGCTDTDGGKDYDIRGTVQNPRSPIGLTSARDRCVSNVTLNEYYCEKVTDQSYDYQISSEQYKCPVLCFNGVCVEEIS